MIHLERSKWPELSALYCRSSFKNVVERNLGETGCEHLSKADWKKLSILDLGRYVDMQRIVKLKLKDANI